MPKIPIEKPPQNHGGKPIPPPKPKPNSIFGAPIPKGASITRAELKAWIKQKVNPQISKFAEDIKYRNKWAQKVNAYLRKLP